MLADALFAPDPKVFCHVAEVGGTVVGFAHWYLTPSVAKITREPNGQMWSLSSRVILARRSR